MRRLSRLATLVFAFVNILVILGMMFCAYTSYIHPHEHPNWSCFGMVFPVFLIADVLFAAFWLVLNRRMLLLPLSGMLLCCYSVRTYCPINIPSTPPDGSIKVLSYNVMGLQGCGDAQPEEIIQYVLNSDADIVCLQEYGGSWELRNQLTEQYPHYTMQTLRGVNFGLLSRYPILSSQPLQYESASNGSYAFELLIGVDTVLFVANHLESYHLDTTDEGRYEQLLHNSRSVVRSQEAIRVSRDLSMALLPKLAQATAIRSLQADSVAAFIAADRHKYKIMCGDYNTPSLSYVHHKMAENMRDAYTMSGNGPGISFNAHRMYFRIDNIMVSPNITSYGAKVDHSCKASDHYPISCWLHLE